MQYVYLKRFVGGILRFILWGLDNVLRFLSLLIPVGLYMLIMQLRTKASSTSSIGAYFTNDSEWQFIYSGTMLVMLEPNSLKAKFKKGKANATNFLEVNKIWLILLCTVCVVAVALKILL